MFVGIENLSAQAPAERLIKVSIPLWKVIGPFGHPEFVHRPGNPDEAGWFLKGLMWSTQYPPDREINLQAVYKDELTKDCKGLTRRLKWENRPARMGLVETREIKPDNVGVAFFVAWVQVPQDMMVKMEFPAYEPKNEKDIVKFGATQHVWVNGNLLETPQFYIGCPYSWHPRQGQEVFLKEGWNMVYARVQSWFAGTRFGAELHVPLDLSKRLVFKNDPPMPLAVPMVL
ncbi:MAG: hypothetical protein SFY92_04550, partial [Verrucomicrobiae bacterium]|nr:hypothetical protein [Verrucomicrobiae bacterium]